MHTGMCFHILKIPVIKHWSNEPTQPDSALIPVLHSALISVPDSALLPVHD